MPEERPIPLMGERLAAIYQRFESALVIAAAATAGVALIYLAVGWAGRYWAAGAWAPMIGVAACALVLIGSLVWAVVSRSRVALPLAVILLAFVVLPWLGGLWHIVHP